MPTLVTGGTRMNSRKILVFEHGDFFELVGMMLAAECCGKTRGHS